MKDFEYIRPESLKESLSIISNFRGQAKIMAGGTDLLVKMKEGVLSPSVVIDLDKIGELKRVSLETNECLRIGSMVKLSEIEQGFASDSKFSVLSKAAHQIGSPQIRNLATIGGNICSASPAADMIPALLVLDAQFRVMSLNGEHLLPAETFFKGPWKSALKDEEMLIEILLPMLPEHTDCIYVKWSPRGAMDIAIVGIALRLHLEEGGFCRDIRIALGAVSPTPVRAKRTEELLKGKYLVPRLIEQASQQVTREADPISDIRGSRGFRMQILSTITYQILSRFIGRHYSESKSYGL